MIDNCVEIYDDRSMDASIWNDLIKRLNGHFVHTYEWSQCMSRINRTACRYLLIRKHGVPAAAGWYTTAGKKIGPFIINKHLGMEALPCYDRATISPQETFDEILSTARKERSIGIFFGNSPQEFLPVDGRCSIDKKINFTLDLDQPLNALHANLKGSFRRKLRKTAAHDIRITCFNKDDDLTMSGMLHTLFEHTISRHISLGKERHEQEVSFMLDCILDLVRSGNAVLFIASRENAPLSCILVSTFNGHAVYLFGASSPQGYQLNASYKIMWTIVEYLKANGFRTFSLGEVPAKAQDEKDLDHGLYRFKSEFGGQRTELISGTVIIRPVTYEIMSVIKRLKNSLETRELAACLAAIVVD
jgi:hypothetical protein